MMIEHFEQECRFAIQTLCLPQDEVLKVHASVGYSYVYLALVAAHACALSHASTARTHTQFTRKNLQPFRGECALPRAGRLTENMSKTDIRR